MSVTTLRKIQIGFLVLILLAIPLVSILNRQVQTSESQASERNFWGQRSKKTFSLMGYVFEDKNRNQIKDANENGVSGVTVIIKSGEKKNYQRNRKRTINSEIQTDSFGFFKYNIANRESLNSLSYGISIKPPEGYEITTKNQTAKRDFPRKAERIIAIGIAPILLSPTISLSPSPSSSPSATPVPTLTIPPVLTSTTTIMPSVIAETPDQTPTATADIPTPTITPSLICPSPPSCDGELITVDQENSLMCPIYICYSSAPVE